MEAKMAVPFLDLPVWLFWDCDPATVDLDEHAPTVVSRVIERGRLDDWRAIRAFYGDERLRQIVTGLRWLSPQALSFCSVALDISKESFRCFTATQSPQAPWPS
ncbi:MAG: DUF6922 domain-containing protein [Verrucomicrobiales bacterium]